MVWGAIHHASSGPHPWPKCSTGPGKLPGFSSPSQAADPRTGWQRRPPSHAERRLSSGGRRKPKASAPPRPQPLTGLANRTQGWYLWPPPNTWAKAPWAQHRPGSPPDSGGLQLETRQAEDMPKRVEGRKWGGPVKRGAQERPGEMHKSVWKEACPPPNATLRPGISWEQGQMSLRWRGSWDLPAPGGSCFPARASLGGEKEESPGSPHARARGSWDPMLSPLEDRAPLHPFLET